jgi:PHD/YefM family antitoxin component YafN of YafNO toxin-antitoxin module
MKMVAYASNELIPSSDFAKMFGSYLAQIKSSAIEKIAILKNNNIEAVLLSKNEYESMKKFSDIGKQYLLDEEINRRVEEYKENKNISVPFSDGLDELREKILNK